MKEETTQQKIRKVFRFLQAKETLHDEHNNNGYVVLSGKKYFVGCMSYNEWYLEPYHRGCTERDDFHKDTLWEKSDTAELLDLFVENSLLEIKLPFDDEEIIEDCAKTGHKLYHNPKKMTYNIEVSDNEI